MTACWQRDFAKSKDGKVERAEDTDTFQVHHKFDSILIVSPECIKDVPKTKKGTSQTAYCRILNYKFCGTQDEMRNACKKFHQRKRSRPFKRINTGGLVELMKARCGGSNHIN